MGRIDNPTPANNASSEKDSSRLVKDEVTYTDRQQQPAVAEFPPRRPQESPSQWPPTSADNYVAVVAPPPMHYPNQGPPPMQYPNQGPPPMHYPNQGQLANTGPNPQMPRPTNFGIVHTTPWNTGLFDCMNDPENALITFCFPCFTFGQIAEIVDQGQTTCQSSAMFHGLFALVCLSCFMSSPYRTRIRNKFGLIEDSGPDCFIHFFCELCALCQEFRELQSRDLDPSIGWVANMMRQQHAAMVPPESNHMTR